MRRLKRWWPWFYYRYTAIGRRELADLEQEYAAWRFMAFALIHQNMEALATELWIEASRESRPPETIH